jgi:hypothetical protein
MLPVRRPPVRRLPVPLFPVLLKGGPQTVAVHGLYVALHLLARAAGDDRTALVKYVWKTYVT